MVQKCKRRDVGVYHTRKGHRPRNASLRFGGYTSAWEPFIDLLQLEKVRNLLRPESSKL